MEFTTHVGFVYLIYHHICPELYTFADVLKLGEVRQVSPSEPTSLIVLVLHSIETSWTNFLGYEINLCPDLVPCTYTNQDTQTPRHPGMFTLSSLFILLTQDKPHLRLRPRETSFPGKYRQTILDTLSVPPHKVLGYLDLPNPDHIWELVIFYRLENKFLITDGPIPLLAKRLLEGSRECVDLRGLFKVLLSQTEDQAVFYTQVIPLFECIQYHLKLQVFQKRVQKL
jgi:hypothetical protein